MTNNSGLDTQQHFAVNDRLANYGDGVFTTMHVTAGRVGLLLRHLRRLVHDAARLGIDVDSEAIQERIAQAIPAQGDGVLKVLIGAGTGGRGYARNPHGPLSLAITWHQVPAHYQQWRNTGIRLGTVAVHLARQPLLAGLKHANRLEQVLIKQALAHSANEDCVVTDTQGQLIEASAANLFWYAQGQWHTPDLSNAGVNGVMRQFILAHHNVTVGTYTLESLFTAQAVFLSNALMQIVPVTTLTTDNGHYSFAIEPVLQLRDLLQAAYDSECVGA